MFITENLIINLPCLFFLLFCNAAQLLTFTLGVICYDKNKILGHLKTRNIFIFSHLTAPKTFILHPEDSEGENKD